MAFEDHLAATRALAALGKRLGRYGLTLHPRKTRFVDFRFKRPGGDRHLATDGASFNFLGFSVLQRHPKEGDIRENKMS